MASFDIDASNPQDDDLVSQFPANERASRTAIDGTLEIEHDVASGHHKLPGGTTAERDAITTWKQYSVWLNEDSSPVRLQVQIAASAPFSWVSIGPTAATPSFPSGTKMVFFQAAPPPGWTQDTSVHDYMLRAVSTTVDGGLTGGTWTMSGISVDDHVLTLDEIPAHSHGYTAPNQDNLIVVDASGNFYYNTVSASTDTAGGGEGHSHPVTSDGSWRPAYANVIIATKD